MNGPEVLVMAATKCGVGVCFANAGTIEMPIVVAGP